MNRFDLEGYVARSEFLTTPSPWGHTAWRRWGQGEPVVLFHGGTGSWMHWVTTIPALEHQYSVLVPDLPGMGESDRPEKMEPVEELVEAMGEAVNAGLDALLGNEAFHCVGFSFGAMVAAFVAAWQGDAVRSYTMIGASGLGLKYPGPRGLRKPSPELDEVEIRAVHQANMGAIMFGDANHVDDAALEMQLLNAAKMRVRSHTAAATEVMLAPLGAMTAPKYGFWGTHDPYLPNEQGPFFSLMTEREIQFELIDNAGHWAQYQGADVFNQRLLQILASNKA